MARCAYPLRAGLTGVCGWLAAALLSVALSLSLLPACSAAPSSLLASASGYVLNAPLLLQGTNVGVTLDSLLSTVQLQSAQIAQQLAEITQLKDTVQLQQQLIATLTTRVDAVLTPVAIRAEPQSTGSVFVQWSLSKTVVTAHPGGKTCEVSGVGMGSILQLCTVEGLDMGVNYTFTAQVSNAAGAGPVSPPSNPVLMLPCVRLYVIVGTYWYLGTPATNPTKSPNCPNSYFHPNSTVQILTNAGLSYRALWSGTANVAAMLPESNSSVTITMPDTEPTIHVRFEQCVPLRMGSWDAALGSVAVLSPERTAGCPDPQTYVYGETVVVQATAAPGHTFVQWTGFGSGSGALLNITWPNTNTDITLQPVFSPCVTLLLPVEPAGVGTVSRSPTHSPSCAEGSYAPGVAVSISAVATSGAYMFVDWFDGVATLVTTPVYTVLGMPSTPLTLTARFAPF